MIKAGATLKNGRQMLILGLSRRNTELLLAGKPIEVDPTAHNIDGPVIVIMAGETEDAIMAELERLMPAGVKLEGSGV